jgi:hypothetical protein
VITFDKLVDLVIADDQVRATIERPELEHVVRKTLQSVGLVVSAINGEVYNPAPSSVVVFPNNNARRRGGRR